MPTYKDEKTGLWYCKFVYKDWTGKSIQKKKMGFKLQREAKESKTAYLARIKDAKHPLIEKIFREYAPKYDARATELGQGGGYTRILKLDLRRGDAAQRVIVKLI